MKVKEANAMLEKKQAVFQDIQKLETLLRNNEVICRELNEKCGVADLFRSITFARMSFYDNEILKLKTLIDEAEIEIDGK